MAKATTAAITVSKIFFHLLRLRHKNKATDTVVRLVKYEKSLILEILINFTYTTGNYNCNEKSPKSQGGNTEMRFCAGPVFLGIFHFSDYNRLISLRITYVLFLIL